MNEKYFIIKEKCEEKNMSIADLSRATGLTFLAVSNVYNGKAWPRIENLQKIAKALDCEVTDLFYHKETISSSVPQSIIIELPDGRKVQYVAKDIVV